MPHTLFRERVAAVAQILTDGMGYAIRENQKILSAESKQHDTTDTEQKFGMYMREFDFLEYELESLEVCLIL